MNNFKELANMDVMELLGLYSDILTELYDKRILRSVNNPAADYAEYLVTRAFDLTRAPLSTKGYDAVDKKGKRYEIKSRRLTRRSKPKRFSAIRKLEEEHFDYLVAVVFNEDFSVQKASIFPKHYIVKKAFWQEHVKAWILPIDNALWEAAEGLDISTKLKEFQKNKV